MNLERKAPPIPIDKPISWEDWLKGREWRRELGNRVAPALIRRERGPHDRRLRERFNGERGLPFKKSTGP